MSASLCLSADIAPKSDLQDCIFTSLSSRVQNILLHFHTFFLWKNCLQAVTPYLLCKNPEIRSLDKKLENWIAEALKHVLIKNYNMHL